MRSLIRSTPDTSEALGLSVSHRAPEGTSCGSDGEVVQAHSGGSGGEALDL